MDSIIAASLVFPTVLYSLLLSVVLVYWVFVLLGALDMDVFDFDVDGDVGVDLDADVDVDVDVDADADVDADGHATFADWLARLDLTEIPLTVSISLFTLLSWFLCVVSIQLIGALATTLIAGTSLAIGAAAVALFATSRFAVLLKPMFRTHPAPRHRSLIGQTCVITTLSVSERHGQAEVSDGGAGLLIQVRGLESDRLAKGDEALIYDYDAENEIFSVKPLTTHA